MEKQRVRFTISRMSTLDIRDPSSSSFNGEVTRQILSRFCSRSRGLAQGKVFPDPVPATTVGSSPGVSASARSIRQLYGVLVVHKVVMVSESVCREASES